MGFRLGDISNPTEAGEIRGFQREVACDCWFTSQGKTIPRAVKVMDGEGMLHTLDKIQVLSSEEKCFSGIATVEHVCKIVIGGREETVRLIFRKDICKWTMIRL